MKTNALSLLALAGALFLMAACASEETNNKQEQAQKPDTKGLTAFTVDGGATRTTAEYDGSGLNFYWTEGDRLWVNNGTLIQDNSNNISAMLTPNPTTPTGVKRAATARFYFAGTYTAPSYPVRYTGKGSTAGNKVTIKAQQSQALPNDAAHISTDGDCGTGTAINSGGGYNFTLDHKASYITFMPYNALGVIDKAKITKIKVTADKPIAGTFSFDDNGINTASPLNPSNTIELTPNSSSATDFTIPATPTATVNATTMVIAPGTYHTFTIEYTLHDNTTNKGGTISKTYNNITFIAGRNKRVTVDLKIKEYRSLDNYGFWHYDPRLPNINELFYYVFNGDPHWDNGLWAYYGSLHRGGIWLKKLAVIYNDLKAAGYTQLNSQGDMKYRYYSSASDATGRNIEQTWFSNTPGVLAGTPPANTSDYFHLPALGGTGYPTDSHGYYWTSSSSPYGGGADVAFLSFTSSSVAVASNYKYAVWFIFQPFE